MRLPAADAADDVLLDAVQRQTLRYFWHYAHPVSFMALDRSVPGTYGPDAVAVGGTGFGLMGLLAGVERGWLRRSAVLERLRAVVGFLGSAERFHGVFPHFLDGRTGRAIPFGADDDGGDIVETAFLMMGLLGCRAFFDRPDMAEARLRTAIDDLWRAVEWDWHAGDGATLYWHWSPTVGWARNFPVAGWNECLVTYVLAAGSPTHPIETAVYRSCWEGGAAFRNGNVFYGVRLPLGPDFGGPLCFAHYSFLGLDPRRLADRHVHYWEQNTAHVEINRRHCIANPGRYEGYGADCWGLTASDDDLGYNQHAPDCDLGVISPTAALSSFPYAPEHAFLALRTFTGRLGRKLWTPRGLRDSFCESRNWFAPTTLAIDQGPIVGMIENHRSGLLWSLFMSCPEVRAGLDRLGFSERSPAPSRPDGERPDD
ncbi:glucoamylase family protein [Alsobacter sp. R-9]